MMSTLLVSLCVMASAPSPAASSQASLAAESTPPVRPSAAAVRPLAALLLPPAFVEWGALAAAAASAVALVGAAWGVFEAASLPPRLVLGVLIGTGVFVGAVAAGSLFFLLSPDARQGRERVARGP